MPSLASMRSIDPTETFQPLGPAVKPAPAVSPAPASKPTGTPGVVQLPDGKLATQLPLPGSKPAAKLDLRDEYIESLSGPAWFQREYMSQPLEAATRKPRIGDFVRMVGGVYQITVVHDRAIEVAEAP